MISLLKDYRNNVDKLLRILKESALEFDRYKDISSGTFFSHKNISFNFHGIGCLFIIDNLVKVDIDYAKERYDGVDFFFLKSFWKTSKFYDEIIDEESFKKTFYHLVEEGYLIKDSKYNFTYYLKSEYNIPKEFNWDLNNIP